MLGVLVDSGDGREDSFVVVGFAKVYLREKQMILDSMGLQDSGLIESFES